MSCQRMLMASSILLFIIAISFSWGEVGAASVDFLESTPGSYLRVTTSDQIQEHTFFPADLSAAVSVLLGIVPSSISDESASKLNDLLVPNPFHRPHGILMLTIDHSKSVKMTSAQHWDLEPKSFRAASLKIPDYTTFLLLNETLEEVSQIDDDVKLQEMATFLGGSYTRGNGPANGILSLPLDDGLVTLDLQKVGNWMFVQKLLSLIAHAKNVAVVLRNIPGGFIVGTLPTVEELRQGSESSIEPEQASGLVLFIVNKIFTYIDAAFNGGLVGVIVNGKEPILDFKFTRGPSRLQLLQTSDTLTATVAEVLTETIIAYITGILFIVALIIGSCFLFKMPVTKDTLLYSGAKLD